MRCEIPKKTTYILHITVFVYTFIQHIVILLIIKLGQKTSEKIIEKNQYTSVEITMRKKSTEALDAISIISKSLPK